jgi:hypothetical protein
MIDDDVHQRVKPTRLGRVLDAYRQAAGDASGNGSPVDSSTGEDA